MFGRRVSSFRAMYTYMRICMCIYIHIFVCIYLYIYINVYIYVCQYIYTCILNGGMDRQIVASQRWPVARGRLPSLRRPTTARSSAKLRRASGSLLKGPSGPLSIFRSIHLSLYIYTHIYEVCVMCTYICIYVYTYTCIRCCVAYTYIHMYVYV